MNKITLCHIDDIPDDSARGFTTDKLNLFAVKRQGQIYLYRNRCPHAGIPLEWMPDIFLDREKQYIQCSSHGALFSIDNGYCVAGPCSGKSLTAVEFEIINSEVVISS